MSIIKKVAAWFSSAPCSPASVSMIERRSYSAAALLAEHPPRRSSANKRAVFARSCPAERPPAGRVAFSRWRLGALAFHTGDAAGLYWRPWPGPGRRSMASWRRSWRRVFSGGKRRELIES